jgi:hypothetical protein
MRPTSGPPLPTRREVLAAGLACWSVAVLGSSSRGSERTVQGPDWIDHHQRGPFVIRSTTPLTSAELAAADLGELQRELRRVLALPPPRVEVEVCVLRDADEHRRVVAALHPKAPYRRALFVKQGDRATVFAYRHSELAIDLRHEATHALLAADLPHLPLWLDEGLAEYFEAGASDRPAGPAHFERLVWDFRIGRVGSLVALEKKRDIAELSRSDYRHAWAWTHFLLHGPGPATAAFWGFLTALRRGEPAGDLSGRLAASLPDYESRLAAHFKHWPTVLQAAQAAGGAGVR